MVTYVWYAGRQAGGRSKPEPLILDYEDEEEHGAIGERERDWGGMYITTRLGA